MTTNWGHPETCPKCGAPRQVGDFECPMCGIVYERYKPNRPPRPVPAPPIDWNPYQAPATPSVDLRVPPSTAPLASRGHRLLARIVDNFSYGLAVFVGAFLGAPFMPQDELATGDDTVGLVMLIAMGVAAGALFVFNLYLLRDSGQTLGKKLLRVRIVRTNGDRASLGHLFLLRMLAPGALGAIPVLGPLFNLVNYCLIFGEERRCIHDYFADTKVVVA